MRELNIVNELSIRLFLDECQEGIIIHRKNDSLIWNNFEWDIENNWLMIINKNTNEKYILKNLSEWEITDNKYYIILSKDNECIWIEMI